MRTGLICSDNLKGILHELLKARSITVDDRANVYIVEAGFELPCGKIAIVFDTGNLAVLVEMLDRLSKAGEDSSDTVVGRQDEKYEVILLKHVHYYEGRGNNVFCITAKGEYRVREKLYELEESLPQNRFVRVSKSFIVNIANVKEIIPWFGRRLVLRFIDSKREVEVSKNYVKSFKDFLGI